MNKRNKRTCKKARHKQRKKKQINKRSKQTELRKKKQMNKRNKQTEVNRHKQRKEKQMNKQNKQTNRQTDVKHGIKIHSIVYSSHTRLSYFSKTKYIFIFIFRSNFKTNVSMLFQTSIIFAIIIFSNYFYII